MMERIAQVSPRSRARIAGVVYLLFFLTAVLGGVFTPATANSILAHESSFRLGYALTLISTACYVAVAALFYQLFRPVSRSFALMAAFFSLVGCVITAVQSLFQLASLVVLGGGQYSSVFNVKQLQALAQMFLDLNLQAGYVAIVFFGVFDLLIGYLIFRSTFLPRILGALMAVAGLGWLTFLLPPLANSHYLSLPIDILGFLAEVALMLWLIVMGVNGQRWTEQASAAGIPGQGSTKVLPNPA
jgi:uncharacterized protein DUF4386